MTSRSDFLVYLIDEEQGSRELLQDTLQQAGYRVLTFSDPEFARAEMPVNPPHVVLATDHLGGVDAVALLETQQKILPESQFIFLEENRDIERSLEMLRRGAYGFLRKPLTNLPEVVVHVDRAVEKIFLNQKNDVLLKEIEKRNDIIQAMEAREKSQFQDTFVAEEVFDVLEPLRNPNDLIEAYVQHMGPVLGEEKIAFLKHAPAYYSLTVTHGYGVDLARLRGLGVNFKDHPKEYPEVLMNLTESREAQEFLQVAFGVDEYVLQPLVVGEEVYGVFVFFRRIDEPHLQRITRLSLRALSLQLENVLIEKKVHDQAVRDWNTGLFNKKFFLERLDEELSRARRIQMPLSVIRADVDHMGFYNQIMGPHAGDLLLRMAGNLIKKTSRKTDFVGFLGDDEFAVILPHTPGIGAAVRAERLRRLFESALFPGREQQPLGTVTLSFGVSEYPSICHDAETLMESAARALDQIKTSTRNQVCLANAPKGHSPDFGAQEWGGIHDGLPAHLRRS